MLSGLNRYTVFDVETPNARNDRMSAIGISILEEGQIVSEFYTFVNPETHMDSFNVQLTGITPEMIKDQPTFPQVWETIRPMMEDSVLVAHNAIFDLGVLSKCLRYYGIPWKRNAEYLCTYQLARKHIKSTANHRLNTLCCHFGIELEHHLASSDSHACAEILLRIMDSTNNVEEQIKTYTFFQESASYERHF